MMVRSDQSGAYHVSILGLSGIWRLEAGAARARYTGTNRPGRRPACTGSTLGDITSPENCWMCREVT
jgi:hypothetical protein